MESMKNHVSRKIMALICVTALTSCDGASLFEDIAEAPADPTSAQGWPTLIPQPQIEGLEEQRIDSQAKQAELDALRDLQNGAQ